MNSGIGRLTIPPSEWPYGHVQQWQYARQPANPFSKPNPAAGWGPNRCRKLEDAWGMYLGFLARKKLLDPMLRPAFCVTQPLVEEYISELCLRVVPVTSAMYISYLSVMIEALEPAGDWQWLRDIGQYLKITAAPARDKRKLVVPARDLYELGVELMRDAEAHSTCHRSVATRFRDGFMISFLATLPLRLGNFSSIELGTHLIRAECEYWLQFSAEETKTGRPIDVCIPNGDFDLVSWLERYLVRHRRWLLEQRSDYGLPSRALWINSTGRKMSRKAIYDNITAHTSAAFGHPIWPHLFRDSVATSIAIEAPDHVGAIAEILGHATLATARKYYIQANSLSANREYQKLIQKIRNDHSLIALGTKGQ
jgi:integrase/recombinase XerD